MLVLGSCSQWNQELITKQFRTWPKIPSRMWRGDAGDDMELRSRLRTARKRTQGWEVQAGGNGRLSKWTRSPRTEKGGQSGVNSGADQSKDRGWVSSWDTEGDGDDP